MRLTQKEKHFLQGIIGCLEQGTIWAFCPKCKIPLSLEEFKKLKCNTCGKIKTKGKEGEYITYSTKTEVC